VADTAAGRDFEAERLGADDPPPGPTALAGLHVLVVDDQDEARLLLDTVLSRCGAAVTLCPSAAAGIEAIEQVRPDVVVADIGMPGMDGYDMMRRVRANPALAGGPPAIALTGYGSPEDRRRALDAGYQEHLAKPVVPDLLVRVIEGLVEATRPH
jgi:CheY-like chemotaxis protein